MRDGVVRLCAGADLVIYDTMFTAEDYRRIPHYGHSRPSDAVDICREAGANRLVLFHHAPERTDAEIDGILADDAHAGRDATPAGWRSSAAYEGLDVEIGRADGDLLLGRARVDSGAGAGDGTLWRQHLVRLAAAERAAASSFSIAALARATWGWR